MSEKNPANDLNNVSHTELSLPGIVGKPSCQGRADENETASLPLIKLKHHRPLLHPCMGRAVLQLAHPWDRGGANLQPPATHTDVLKKTKQGKTGESFYDSPHKHYPS